jgi:hypothetical protein
MEYRETPPEFPMPRTWFWYIFGGAEASDHHRNSKAVPTTVSTASTNKASNTLSPSALGSPTANPRMVPHFATNTLPAVICPRGTSIASVG